MMVGRGLTLGDFPEETSSYGCRGDQAIILDERCSVIPLKCLCFVLCMDVG
jgi:hypothetical protein